MKVSPTFRVKYRNLVHFETHSPDVHFWSLGVYIRGFTFNTEHQADFHITPALISLQVYKSHLCDCIQMWQDLWLMMSIWVAWATWKAKDSGSVEYCTESWLTNRSVIGLYSKYILLKLFVVQELIKCYTAFKFSCTAYVLFLFHSIVQWTCLY